MSEHEFVVIPRKLAEALLTYEWKGELAASNHTILSGIVEGRIHIADAQPSPAPVAASQGEDGREVYIQRMIEERDLSRTMAAHMWDSRQEEPNKKPQLVECDACPTSGGCVDTCMKAPARQVGGEGRELIVMPENKKPFTCKTIYADGWNDALNEVARLNRRAIPAGLLERIIAPASNNDERVDRAWAINELRALLGKP